MENITFSYHEACFKKFQDKKVRRVSRNDQKLSAEEDFLPTEEKIR